MQPMPIKYIVIIALTVVLGLVWNIHAWQHPEKTHRQLVLELLK